MAAPSSTSDAVFRLSPRIELFPVLHGSGDVAQEVRDRLTALNVETLTGWALTDFADDGDGAEHAQKAGAEPRNSEILARRRRHSRFA